MDHRDRSVSHSDNAYTRRGESSDEVRFALDSMAIDCWQKKGGDFFLSPLYFSRSA